MKYLSIALAGLGLCGCMRNVDLPAARTLSGETVREGCLNRTESGEYVLSDGKTGVRMNVRGNPMLDLNAENHAVRLVGTVVGTGMRVVRVDYLASGCRAPFPK